MLEARRIVSDTGPLITAEKLPGGFELLQLLYDQILIPQAVLLELQRGVPEAGVDYLDLFDIRGFVTPVEVEFDSFLLPHLDRGEREALHLAEQESLPLLIEELAGRRAAIAMGLKISGMAGQVIRGRRLKLIGQGTAIDMLRGLRTAGRIPEVLFQELLVAVSA